MLAVITDSFYKKPNISIENLKDDLYCLEIKEADSVSKIILNTEALDKIISLSSSVIQDADATLAKK